MNKEILPGPLARGAGTSEDVPGCVILPGAIGPGHRFARTYEAELLWPPSFAVTFPAAGDADSPSCRTPRSDPPRDSERQHHFPRHL